MTSSSRWACRWSRTRASAASAGRARSGAGAPAWRWASPTTIAASASDRASVAPGSAKASTVRAISAARTGSSDRMLGKASAQGGRMPASSSTAATVSGATYSIRYRKPSALVAWPSWISAGLKVMTDPGRVRCVPPRQKKLCDPASVRPMA